MDEIKVQMGNLGGPTPPGYSPPTNDSDPSADALIANRTKHAYYHKAYLLSDQAQRVLLLYMLKALLSRAPSPMYSGVQFEKQYNWLVVSVADIQIVLVAAFLAFYGSMADFVWNLQRTLRRDHANGDHENGSLRSSQSAFIWGFCVFDILQKLSGWGILRYAVDIPDSVFLGCLLSSMILSTLMHILNTCVAGRMPCLFAADVAASTAEKIMKLGVFIHYVDYDDFRWGHLLTIQALALVAYVASAWSYGTFKFNTAPDVPELKINSNKDDHEYFFKAHVICDQAQKVLLLRLIRAYLSRSKDSTMPPMWWTPDPEHNWELLAVMDIIEALVVAFLGFYKDSASQLYDIRKAKTGLDCTQTIFVVVFFLFDVGQRFSMWGLLRYVTGNASDSAFYACFVTTSVVVVLCNAWSMHAMIYEQADSHRSTNVALGVRSLLAAFGDNVTKIAFVLFFVCEQHADFRYAHMAAIQSGAVLAFFVTAITYGGVKFV